MRWPQLRSSMNLWKPWSIVLRRCRRALRRLHRGAPHNVVAELDLTFGNVEEAFGHASQVYSDRFHQSRGGSHSIECRGVLAAHDPVQDVLTVWSSTQTPHAAMRLIAHMLRREEKSVRVIAPDVGGGFGPKLVFYSEELVVALAAILLRRPVKWIEDRREHFISTTQERDQVWNLEIAVDSEGAIRGIRGSMIHDHGAYTARGINVAFEAMQTLTMPYNVPACSLKVTLALTNKVPVTPVRGAGQPQGVFAMERLLDRVAVGLRLDRAEVRKRNLVRREQMPCSKPFKTRAGVPVVIDSGDLLACQDKALALAGWSDFSRRKERSQSQRTVFRHRSGQFRRIDRSRALRARYSPDHVVRQNSRAFERGGDGTKHQNDACADRIRPAWRRHRKHNRYYRRLRNVDDRLRRLW